MASTNKTTNYNLSQYIGTDKPTYLGDYNSDMQKIDEQMKQNADDVATAINSASTATSTANSANTTAQSALNTAQTANTTAGQANTTATNAQTTANSALSTATTAQSTADNNTSAISTLRSDMENRYKSETVLLNWTLANGIYNSLSDSLNNYEFILIEISTENTDSSGHAATTFLPVKSIIDYFWEESTSQNRGKTLDLYINYVDSNSVRFMYQKDTDKVRVWKTDQIPGNIYYKISAFI